MSLNHPDSNEHSIIFLKTVEYLNLIRTHPPHHGGLGIGVAQGAVQVQVVPRGAEGRVVERGARAPVQAAAGGQLPLYWPAFPGSRTSHQLD